MMLYRLLPLRPVVINNFFSEDPKSQNLQIWAVDPWTLSTPVKLSTSNGTLKPLYLIQRENNNTICSNSADCNKTARSPRGRSYSPPKRISITNTAKNEERERFIAVSNDDDCFQSLHKSISSEQIRSNGKILSNSFSSSNSDASMRSGNWQKNFRSAIPVPVSSDSRLRFRTRGVEISKGPVSIPPQFYRTKSPSLVATPDRNTISQGSVLERQPFSSSSDSELCTPPAEPLLTTNFSRKFEESPLKSPCRSESFIEVDSPRYHNENFTVIDDSAPDVLEQNKTFSRANSATSRLESVSLAIEELALNNARLQRENTQDSFHTQDEFESDDAHTTHETSQTIPVDDFEQFGIERTFTTENQLSRSEVNIKISPQLSRKSVNSAPAQNEIMRFETNSRTTVEITLLPGSVSDTTPEHEITEVKTPKITKPTLKRQLSRKNSVRGSKRDATQLPEHSYPFPKIKEGLSETFSLLEHGDWEMTMKGLQGVLRLTRHHPETTDLHMHAICVALGKQIRNLRSQVARAACLAASEMFCNHKKCLEVELEEIAVPLLHRTADTNKFLRGDANSALDKMCLHMAPPRVVSIVATKGGGHQNAIVRCTAARLLCSLTTRLGAEKTFQLPKDSRDKILYSGANMLMEGNLETRKHAKMMFGTLAGHSQFNKAMMEAVPVCTMRHIQKTLKSLQ